MDRRRKVQVGIAGTLATLVLVGAGITAASGAIGGKAVDRSYDAVENARAVSAPTQIDRSFDAAEKTRASNFAVSADTSYDAVEASRSSGWNAPVNNNHDMAAEGRKHRLLRK